tara:strand:- start:7543 stop:8271 length:729 start_codon:yes stop_codon:yes gene_type:complete
MNSPLVSVIIPSFNRLNYLLRSIESVFNQTYTKTEVIVVNDGSTEEGYLEHKYIKDIKQINLEQNQKIINGFGPGNIRNFGINIASGDWIAFLDDDDLWLKEKLEIQLNMINDTGLKMSSTDALIGNGIYDKKLEYKSFLNEHYYKKIKKSVFRNYFIYRFKKLIYPDRFTKEFISTVNPIITSSVLLDTDLVKQLKGFRNLPYAADYDLWKGVLQFTDCLYIDKPLIYYDNSHGYGREYKK